MPSLGLLLGLLGRRLGRQLPGLRRGGQHAFEHVVESRVRGGLWRRSGGLHGFPRACCAYLIADWLGAACFRLLRA